MRKVFLFEERSGSDHRLVGAQDEPLPAANARKERPVEPVADDSDSHRADIKLSALIDAMEKVKEFAAEHGVTTDQCTVRVDEDPLFCVIFVTIMHGPHMGKEAHWAAARPQVREIA